MNVETLFTNDDLMLLDKAIDALPKFGFSAMMLTELLIGSMSKDEDKEFREKEREARFERQKSEDREIEEKCLELKYKLLQLRKIINQNSN